MANGKNSRNKVLQTILVATLAAAFCSAIGCQGERLVKIKIEKGLTAGPGMGTGELAPVAFARIINAVQKQSCDEDKKAKSIYIDFMLQPGDLIGAKIEREKPKYELMMVYPFNGNEKSPLVFSGTDFRMFLNGKLIGLDLRTPEAFTWLEKQPPSVLKTVRAIQLSSQSANNVQILRHFVGSGVILFFMDEVNFNDQDELISSIIDVKPTGLITPKIEDCEKILPKLPHLKYLLLSGKRIPTLSNQKELLSLLFAFEGDDCSLAPLSNIKSLTNLSLIHCNSVKNYQPLANLTNLRRLAIYDCKELKNLQPLAGMQQLRTLSLTNCKTLDDISTLTKLKSLRELALDPLPESKQVQDTLKNLHKLETLVLTEDDLKNRKAEVDEIQKALPDCKIIGFCMGSLWIAVLPISAGVGLLWRRRRAGAKA